MASGVFQRVQDLLYHKKVMVSDFLRRVYSSNPAAFFAGAVEAVFYASFSVFLACKMLESLKPGACTFYFPLKYPFTLTVVLGIAYLLVGRSVRREVDIAQDMSCAMPFYIPCFSAFTFLAILKTVKGSWWKNGVAATGTALAVILVLAMLAPEGGEE